MDYLPTFFFLLAAAQKKKLISFLTIYWEGSDTSNSDKTILPARNLATFWGRGKTYSIPRSRKREKSHSRNCKTHLRLTLQKSQS